MRITLLFAATALCVAAGPAAAQTTNVTGVWRAAFVTPDRTYPARLELKQDGDTLTGTIGSETEANKLTGSIKASNLTFAFTTRDPNGGDQLLAIAVTAALGADGLTGSFNVGNEPTGTFSAAREASKDSIGAKESKESKESKIDVTGTWALTVDLGTITASPTVVFKQDGEGLTGQYTSPQYGQFPLKGTLKGNQIQFGLTMSIEGNAIDVAFSGTADKDSLKGTVTYGGLGDGTFTAKKR